ncbi:hypothetical protein AA309_14635 [Microvirga vignae]|uniref:DUF6894 domain-containing protein n=1 Tax=Microvirga vignae TaxID=1225564 RepID=A0A0H1RC69_9HYPH|nr:hypothetical protein [Microvirga vignae]KLK92441.1 hypothetical protein AA309_14635 [Microvirga vignae]
MKHQTAGAQTGLYHFHLRDGFGLIEDQDGIEPSASFALLMEAIQSGDEFIKEAVNRPEMHFEVADSDGRTVLMMPVQQSTEIWDLLQSLSAASNGVH